MGVPRGGRFLMSEVPLLSDFGTTVDGPGRVCTWGQVPLKTLRGTPAPDIRGNVTNVQKKMEETDPIPVQKCSL